MRSIRVLFFAAAADAVGAQVMEFESEPPADVARLFERLETLHPGAAPLLKRCAAAVNEQYARRSTRLSPGDTVAIIPPVSGG